jgi:hypothetical protein
MPTMGLRILNLYNKNCICNIVILRFFMYQLCKFECIVILCFLNKLLSLLLLSDQSTDISLVLFLFATGSKIINGLSLFVILSQIYVIVHD